MGRDSRDLEVYIPGRSGWLSFSAWTGTAGAGCHPSSSWAGTLGRAGALNA
jgi:hypothetical protein